MACLIYICIQNQIVLLCRKESKQKFNSSVSFSESIQYRFLLVANFTTLPSLYIFNFLLKINNELVIFQYSIKDLNAALVSTKKLHFLLQRNTSFSARGQGFEEENKYLLTTESTHFHWVSYSQRQSRI